MRRELIRQMLREDAGKGDITSEILIGKNVRARGRVYASSLAWRLGLTRREAWREVTDMARTRGWRVIRTPSNHILVISSRGARKLEKAAAQQPT